LSRRSAFARTPIFRQSAAIREHSAKSAFASVVGLVDSDDHDCTGASAGGTTMPEVVACS